MLSGISISLPGFRTVSRLLRTVEKKTSIHCEKDFQSTTEAAPLLPIDRNTSKISASIVELNETYIDERAVLNARWKEAIKLPMYWVAIIPVLVGSAVAFHDYGVLFPNKILKLSAGSICVITWLNLSNDVFDHETGADATKFESTVNITRNKSLISILSYVFLIAGLSLIGQTLLISRSSYVPVLMLITSILCGYIYQGPPFRLSYKGLGEPLCFFAFGPLATTAFYFLMSNRLQCTPSSMCWASSIIVSNSKLFCNHFHQYESDLRAKKYSPIVQLGGAKKALKVLVFFLTSIFIFGYMSVFMGWIPKVFIPCSVFPIFMAFKCLRYAKDNVMNLAKLKVLKLLAVDLHVSFAIVLIVIMITTKTFLYV